jgi:hypothetical protein
LQIVAYEELSLKRGKKSVIYPIRESAAGNELQFYKNKKSTCTLPAYFSLLSKFKEQQEVKVA